MLRNLLIRVRKEYNTRLRWLLQLALGVLLLSALAGFALDFFTPFTGWWNLLRSFVLIPLAASVWVLGYCLTIYLHRRQTALDPTWVPFRFRFSQKWRRNISLILGALIFVLIYGTGFSKAYTFISSCFVALIFSLFVFMRATRDERTREKLGVPDTRDLQYDSYKKRLQEARLKAQEEKDAKKKAKRKFIDDDEE